MRHPAIGAATVRVAAMAFVVIAALAPAVALAWDSAADRAVADLAYERLTPRARTAVDAILAAAGPIGAPGCQVKTLAGAPDLLTCLHDTGDDFMRGVIYPPIPICGPPPPPEQICPNERCASQVLVGALARLKAPDTSPPARALALEEVVYLTAELHQPLHAADNGDHSGDRLQVILPGGGAKVTLYAVWDEDLVAEAIGDAETGLPYLRPLADLHGADWSQGDIAAWVGDTHQVAVTDVYGRLPDPPPCGHAPDRPERLDRAYIDFGAGIVRTQLAKAGVRLAVLLNGALG